jgi:hypothetical protein
MLQLGDDPRQWSDDDVLYAISLLGADQSGNFILGESAFRLWLEQIQEPHASIEETQVLQVYIERSQDAMQDGDIGSSVAGEFPRFTTLRTMKGVPTNVLVKFSGSDDSAGTKLIERCDPRSHAVSLGSRDRALPSPKLGHNYLRLTRIPRYRHSRLCVSDAFRRAESAADRKSSPGFSRGHSTSEGSALSAEGLDDSQRHNSNPGRGLKKCGHGCFVTSNQDPQFSL